MTGGGGGVELGGVLTVRLPPHHSAGSTGALPHPIPPVTSEDQGGGGGGGGESGGLRGSPSPGIKVWKKKFQLLGFESSDPGSRK